MLLDGILMPKSLRSQWSQFTQEERINIMTRDKGKCIMPNCNNTFGTGIAHVFLSKAQGGRGCKENGVVLCQEHHHALDNGNNRELRQQIDKYCKDYLMALYPNLVIADLRYKKYGGKKDD